MFFLTLGQSTGWADMLTGTVYGSSGQYGISNPTESDIRRVIEAIAHGEQDLAILSDDANEDTYIQTADGGRGKLLLEYQDGSLDTHYAATAPAPTVEQVISAFLGFLRGETNWKSAFTWQKMKL
jgi:hypothetical protein